MNQNGFRVLLVKMSSLGDVVQTLAAVTDAQHNLPELRLDWVVEEPYREIPLWHPAVCRVVPIALRRWRKSWTAAIREWLAFRRDLRRDSYDLVLDAQGLYKSAFISAQARGPVAGRSFGTAREGLAALAFSRRYSVPQTGPEVEQVRTLFAAALGYSKPSAPAEFGIDREKLGDSGRGDRCAVFLHGAAWETKLWAEQNWIGLARWLEEKSLHVLLPWGSAGEHERALRIAAASGAEVLPKTAIASLAPILAHSQFVVGLDTGLTHLAVALNVPTITLYGPTTPVYAAVSSPLVNISSTSENRIDTARPNTVSLERVKTAISRVPGLD